MGPSAVLMTSRNPAWAAHAAAFPALALALALAIAAGCDADTAGAEGPDEPAGAWSFPTTDGQTLDDPETEPPGEPCLATEEHVIDFGWLPSGESAERDIRLTNCGEHDLRISRLAVEPQESSSSEAFSLACEPACPTTAAPLVLVPDATLTVIIGYGRAEAATGVTESAVLVVESDGGESLLDVPLQGGALSPECPAAVLDVAEGLLLAPPAVLHLDGSRSAALDAEVVQHTWELVQRPTGSRAELVTDGASATLDAGLAGVYRIRLAVADENGKPSCEPAEVEVHLIPDAALHVEVYWSPVEPPTAAPGAWASGPDLDLHLVHPMAEGVDVDGDGDGDGWFDLLWDCFWFAPAPAWSANGAPTEPTDPTDPTGAASGPVLAREDVSGAGPEVLVLEAPQEGIAYRLGVHHWAEHGTGATQVTARIFVRGELVRHISAVTLREHDLWDVATIAWPSANILVSKTSTDQLRIWPDVTPPAGLE